MTTLRLLSSDALLLSAGRAWKFVLEARDASGYRSSTVEPVVTVFLPGAGASTPVTVATSAEGIFTGSIPTASTGRYLAQALTAEDAVVWAAYVAGVVLDDEMPTVDSVASYIGNRASSYTSTDIADALEAEAAAQRAVCRVGAVYTADLRNALHRRVMRNLALRNLPLMVAGGADGEAPTVLPGRDPEVRRLEAPYRRLVLG